MLELWKRLLNMLYVWIAAHLDASEEYWDKMIARQKTKGKRELLNLKNSINYGEICAPSRGVGKARPT